MRPSLFLLLPLVLGACDDTEFGGHEPTTAVDCETDADWCGVETILDTHCSSCHGGAGGLDLGDDAHGAIVGVESAGNPGETLVIPGDPEGSLLFRKVRGTQSADEGDIMPPGTGLTTHELALMWEWIEGGATDSCEGEPDTGHDTGAGS